MGHARAEFHTPGLAATPAQRCPWLTGHKKKTLMAHPLLG